jgi:hypothetical protein
MTDFMFLILLAGCSFSQNCVTEVEQVAWSLILEGNILNDPLNGNINS